MAFDFFFSIIMIYDYICEYPELLIEFYRNLHSVKAWGKVNYKVDLSVNMKSVRSNLKNAQCRAPSDIIFLSLFL